MSYRLNKTNGELVVELADGQIDNTSTDITLVGRNYRGFGELFNENFIKIVENFSNTSAPDTPLTGQLWYDTNQQRLKIYNGSQFRTAGSPIVSSSRPSLIQGDLWIDNLNRQLYFYDGNADNEFTLVGPAYNQTQGKTGLEVESVIDIDSRTHVVLKMFIAGELFAVISQDTEFLLSSRNKIDGFPDRLNDAVFPPRQEIRKGINLVDPDSFYRGTAESAKGLVDNSGNLTTVNDFLVANQNEETTGSLFIKNTNGLTIGIQDTPYCAIKLVGTTTAIETQQSGTDIALRTKTGNQLKNAIYIKSQTERIGVYNSNPEYGLDITGDFRTTSNAVIEGDLTVKGNASYFNVQTLQVLDKNIELGLLDDSTEGNDETVDGGGITLRSTNGSKDLFWDLAENSWTSNVNFNLESSKSYKINGQNVLSFTELGPTVNTANGLTSIGTLDNLAVDNLRFDTNIISTPAAGSTPVNLILNPSANVSVSSSRIVDASDPVDAQDTATKNYVDNTINSIDVALSLDTTGLNNPSLSNPYNDVKDILESISPANQKQSGTIARIHGVAYNNTTIQGINIDAAADIEYVAVTKITDPFDLEENISEESVVRDINFEFASGTFNAVPLRSTFIFEISDNEWIWQNTV